MEIQAEIEKTIPHPLRPTFYGRITYEGTAWMAYSYLSPEARQLRIKPGDTLFIIKGESDGQAVS